MIIGIDGNEANVQRRVGIGEFAFELLKQFENSQFSNLNFRVYLKDKPREDLPVESKNWRYRIIGPRKLWTQLALPLDLYFYKPRPNVFFSPTHYAPRFSPVPTVVSVMDLSYIHYPEMFRKNDLYQLRNWTSYSVKRAEKVITISRSSKNDIISYYKVQKEKVMIVYPGVKEISNFQFPPAGQAGQISSMDKLKKKYKIDGEYILFVGTLQPRKNIIRLIEAFSKVSDSSSKVRGPKAGTVARHPHPTSSGALLSAGARWGPPTRATRTSFDLDLLQLVIIGKKGWMYEDTLGAPKRFGIENRVKFLDFVPDEDMPSLYQNAVCFVLPSLYEGFGLPVLEAMKYGCPVLASNVSSLPEAGGDAALYFDPENSDDIAEKIGRVVGDEKLRKAMVQKGFERVKKFSWKKAAQETLAVLEEVGKR